MALDLTESCARWHPQAAAPSGIVSIAPCLSSQNLLASSYESLQIPGQIGSLAAPECSQAGAIHQNLVPPAGRYR